jgi:hypothetical protein
MSIRVLKLERATQIRGATFNNVMITAKMNRMTLLKAALRIDHFLPKKWHRDVRYDHCKNEDEHRGCRPVSSVEILKDLTIGVQTDHLGGTPRSTSRRGIDNISNSLKLSMIRKMTPTNTVFRTIGSSILATTWYHFAPSICAASYSSFGIDIRLRISRSRFPRNGNTASAKHAGKLSTNTPIVRAARKSRFGTPIWKAP